MAQLSASDVLKKVRALEIRTRRTVESLFAGQYHSSFKGQGMTFAEFREYIPGDDVRSIAWTLTARTGKTFIKKFDEERELTFFLIVDVSSSMSFGSQGMSKAEAATLISALFGFAATRNNDQVGALLYGSDVEHYVRPRKGLPHVQRILSDLLRRQQEPVPGTRLSSALEQVQAVVRKRATIVIVSDFFELDFERALGPLAKKHEVMAVCVRDPVEEKLPEKGLWQLQNPETGEFFPWDGSSARGFAKHLQEHDAKLAGTLRRHRVDLIPVRTHEDVLKPVTDYFRRRGGR